MSAEHDRPRGTTAPPETPLPHPELPQRLPGGSL